MKTITIGRGDGCTITINDEMISRRHAIIKISTLGKMEIVDMSKNGTFVNGIRLRPNVPFPITRKDVINFANVQQLDWAMVPNPLKYIKWGVLGVGAVVMLIVLITSLKSCFNSEPSPELDEIEEYLQSETAEKPHKKDNTPTETKEKDTDDEHIDAYGIAQENQKKREAEEKEKKKEKNKEKEKEQEQDNQNTDNDESSNKKGKQEIVI